MTNYKTFIFNNYSFDEQTKIAIFEYSYDNELFFTEKYSFNFKFTKYDSVAFDIALKHLFLLCGVSYYKAYLPKNIIIKPFQISKSLAYFLNNTYQKGLRELFYTNNLPIDTKIDFPYSEKLKNQPIKFESSGKLVAIGGGKDSLVSISALQKQATKKLAIWSVGHEQKLRPLVKQIGLPHYGITRQIDSKIISLTNSYNGHIPISAIFASIGSVLCVLTGSKDIVVSNESSANEPTLTFKGLEVNHQYSKSAEFELSYQKLLTENFGNSIRYYSLLRSLNEVQITKIFAENSFAKYKDTFCSCNKAFRQNATNISWCGKCPKCCFVFLALTPFVDKIELEEVFNANPLLDKENINIYKELLGKTQSKPFECVGTINESSWAMNQAYKIYPQLQDVFGEINSTYDISKTEKDYLPEDVSGPVI